MKNARLKKIFGKGTVHPYALMSSLLILVGVALFSMPVFACTTVNWSDTGGPGGMLPGDPFNNGVSRFEGECALKIMVDDQASHYAEDQNPSNESHYIARFYAFLNNLTMANGDEFDLFAAYSDASTKELRLIVRGVSGQKQLFLAARTGTGLEDETPTGIELGDGWHVIEFDWNTDTGTTDVSVERVQNGDISEMSLTNLDNAGAGINFIRLGAVDGTAASTTGSFNMDSFVSQRSGAIEPLLVGDADNEGINEGIVDFADIFAAFDEFVGTKLAPGIPDCTGDGITDFEDIFLMFDVLIGEKDKCQQAAL